MAVNNLGSAMEEHSLGLYTFGGSVAGHDLRSCLVDRWVGDDIEWDRFIIGKSRVGDVVDIDYIWCYVGSVVLDCVLHNFGFLMVNVGLGSGLLG